MNLCTTVMHRDQQLYIALLGNTCRRTTLNNCKHYFAAMQWQHHASVDALQQTMHKQPVDAIVVDDKQSATHRRLNLVREIRWSLGDLIPIMVIASGQIEKDVVATLEAGADSYVTPAVSDVELMARLTALVRRFRYASTIKDISPYRIDVNNRKVWLNDTPIRLREKEFDLLVCLFRHRQRALSRAQLLYWVWGKPADLATRTVDTHISRLRCSLRLSGSNRWKISSVYQQGYRLHEQPAGA